MKSVIAHIRKAQRLVLAVALFAFTGLVCANAAVALDSPNRQSMAIQDTAPAAGTPDVTDEHGVVVEGDAAAHGGEKKGGLPQLDFATYTPQLFWMAIIFFVLYMVMSKKALPDISKIVEGRRDLIDTNLKSAEAARAEGDSIRTAYEKNIETARANAMQAVQDVELAAKKKAADQIDAFRRKAEGELKAAEENVLRAKDKAMGDMMSVATDVASIAAEKITGVSTDRQKAQAIVETIAGKAKAA